MNHCYLMGEKGSQCCLCTFSIIGEAERSCNIFCSSVLLLFVNCLFGPFVHFSKGLFTLFSLICKNLSVNRGFLCH